MDDFNKPKICWASVGATEYSLIPKEYLLLDTNYFFTTDNPLDFLGLLNSKLINWWISTEDTPIGASGAYRHYKYNIEKLHVPTIHNIFSELVSNILQIHHQMESISKIDDMVYKLYHLTDTEKAFFD